MIWDLTGNAWEWGQDTATVEDCVTGAVTGPSWRELTDITGYGTLSYDLLRPSNPAWDDDQETGAIYSDGTDGDTTLNPFLRGGSRFENDNGGPYTLNYFYEPTDTNQALSFRCVTR